MATKPSIPKGTRDFGPQEMLRRKYIFNTIEKVFQKYGYLPLETPAMENLETLTGKYGEEGDRLIFKVQQRGEKLVAAIRESVGKSKTILSFQEWLDAGRPTAEEWVKQRRLTVQDWLGHADTPLKERVADELGKELEVRSTDIALRYDLTVPFARYVVQHQNELVFPFKRYQIQPVWRADRPQKGRYREFYQCDADVIGSTSLLNEVELVQLFDDVFTLLGLKVVVKINDRKVLSGIAEVSGQPEKVVDIVTAIDKLDKIGREKVEEEMRTKGVSVNAIAGIAPLFDLKGSWDEQRPKLEQWLDSSAIAQQGLKDLSRSRSMSSVN